MDDVWRGRIGVLRCADLVYNLPAGSVSWQAVDSPAAWTVQDYLMAQMVDDFRMFCHGLGGGNGKPPKPLPRPGVSAESDRRSSVMSMTPEEMDEFLIRKRGFRDIGTAVR